MEILIAVIGSEMLSVIINCIFKIIEKRRQRKEEIEKKKDTSKNGVKMLMYDRIKYLGCHHIATGEISAEDLEYIIEMHSCYQKDMGDNEYLNQIMDIVKGLRIKG